MKASDYIVEFLIGKGITDIFGYPGGMVTHLMDSLYKYRDRIASHLAYHEQGAAFAACGYAQASGRMGVAYATSGPGATNLVTGICNAYFDSIPVLFITGQVNTYESKQGMRVRQRGFQETDIVSMVSSVTKYAALVESAEDLQNHLERAYAAANEGRKGPVLLDIPMDISRAEISPSPKLPAKSYRASVQEETLYSVLSDSLERSQRPVFLLGNGVKSSQCIDGLCSVLEEMGLPVLTTMIAVDVMAEYRRNYGFLGAYGNRAANFIAAKCDLMVSVGARLDVRQVGANRENFTSAKLIRIDIDPAELDYKVKRQEIPICASADEFAAALSRILRSGFQKRKYDQWIGICEKIKSVLNGIDDRLPNRFVEEIGNRLPCDALVAADVGQNQVWVAQSLKAKKGQRFLFSGGHGAMGYSLPAAIGAYYATKRPTFSFNGDGGFQMNSQELMTVARDNLPIKIVVFNNYALGMIRHFQEMYFSKTYTQTVAGRGYAVPDFQALAYSYGIPYYAADSVEDIGKINVWEKDQAAFVEIRLQEDTYVYPKLEYGKPNQDQEPLLDRKLYEKLMRLGEGEKEMDRKNGGGRRLNRPFSDGRARQRNGYRPYLGDLPLQTEAA